MTADPEYEDDAPDDFGIGEDDLLKESGRRGGFADDEDDGALNSSGRKGG